MPQLFRRRLRALSLAAVVFGLLMATVGCETGRQFRAAASPSVQTGARDILNGLLDGFFAAIAPEPQTGSSNSNSTP